MVLRQTSLHYREVFLNIRVPTGAINFLVPDLTCRFALNYYADDVYNAVNEEEQHQEIEKRFSFRSDRGSKQAKKKQADRCFGKPRCYNDGHGPKNVVFDSLDLLFLT